MTNEKLFFKSAIAILNIKSYYLAFLVLWLLFKAMLKRFLLKS